MRYRITGTDGRDKVEVDAVDWMMAMSKAIQMFGIEVSGWVCDSNADGDTVVTDPASGRSWLVHPLASAIPMTPPPPPPGFGTGGPPGAPPPLPSWLAKGGVTPQTVAPTARKRGIGTLAPSANIPRPPELTPPTTPTAAPAAAPPGPEPSPAPRAKPTSKAKGRPVGPTQRPPPTAVSRPRTPDPMKMSIMPSPPANAGPPADLAERLFDVGFDIAMAGDANSACSTALQIALDLVPCEAGSVLRGGINESNLKFVAVSGPAADKLLGRTVPFGSGIAGASFDMGITIQVNDVAGDTRHEDKYDKETGFQTKSILCVPVRTQTDFFGCLQLLNPTLRFQTWHVDVAETVARSLASTLSGT